jgi:hypothetical protein
MYRSDNAKQMYTLIRAYLTTGREADREQICQLLVLTGDARSYLTEFTHGNYSLLLDCLNVGKKSIVAPTASANAKVLFQQFMEHLTQQEKATLFKKPNSGGFTILHSIILTGDETIVELYFKEINLLLASHVLTPADYSHILVMNEKKDVNILQLAINSRNIKILECYANALRAAFTKGYLPR